MNPLYNTNDSPSNQTTPTKAVNRQGVYVPRTHNTFDNSYFNFKTQRFGQYEPFFVMEGVPGDHIPFSSSHNVRSLPFASPFLSSLKLNKDYFLVPNQAIQPHTWELIFKNPAQGDDVPDDAYNVFSVLGKHNGLDVNIIESLSNAIFNPDFSDSQRFIALMTLEQFASSGCLLYNMGYRISCNVIKEGSSSLVFKTFDDLFDYVINSLTILSFTVTVDGLTVTYDQAMFSKYQILDAFRFFGSSIDHFNVEGFPDLESDGWSILPFADAGQKSLEFNMDRLCAYQLSCAQYYVNPQVDFLYNAQLYRDNFLAMIRSVTSAHIDTFEINGISVLYDSFSRHYYDRLTEAIASCYGSVSSESVCLQIYDLVHLLFGYKESLKFGDYFTDSRTRPLAVGNTDINISVDNSVSVVDISEKIVLQRFLNNVIKLGNNFGDYLRGIFGTTPSPDYHFPKFIVHQDFEISGFEIANTTEIDQGNLVTNLRSGDDTFVFEIDVDMPCVILGISHFSVPMLYSQTKDRHFLHSDRFDFFNPMLQYVGDQPVYLSEKVNYQLDVTKDIIGYQSRFNEYKQRFSVVNGGFISKLPAWSFVIDDVTYDPSYIGLCVFQSPVAIRHKPSDFNRFFKQLSGWSLANSFHFIVVYDNKCVCNRPMEVNPQIL